MQDIFYFDGNNIRRLSYETNTLTLKDTPISEKITPLIRLLPKEQTQATACFTYPFYKLFLRTELSTDNNIALVYNVINKAWSVQTNVFVAHATSGYNSYSLAYLGSAFD